MTTFYTQIASNKRKTVLLVGFFLVLVISVGWVFSQIYNNPFILYFAVGFSLFQAFTSYWWSDKITLAISGAKEVSKKDAPELYRVVENLSITAGLPVPKVYIINDPSPNAFATGRDPKHAAVAITTGLLQKLDKSELEGVMAHEMSHIGNYDIRLSTIIVVLVGIIALLSDWFLRMSFFGGDRDRNTHPALVVAGLVLAILAPIFAVLIQLAVSRKREYLADATGVKLTRFPDGLARALEKIAADPTPLKVANKATAHLFISNPLKKKASGLFSSHPPIQDRVKRLREMGA